MNIFLWFILIAGTLFLGILIGWLADTAITRLMEWVREHHPVKRA